MHFIECIFCITRIFKFYKCISIKSQNESLCLFFILNDLRACCVTFWSRNITTHKAAISLDTRKEDGSLVVKEYNKHTQLLEKADAGDRTELDIVIVDREKESATLYALRKRKRQRRNRHALLRIYVWRGTLLTTRLVQAMTTCSDGDGLTVPLSGRKSTFQTHRQGLLLVFSNQNQQQKV